MMLQSEENALIEEVDYTWLKGKKILLEMPLS